MLFITGNSYKFSEAQAIIADIQQHHLDLPEIQSLNPEEIIQHKILTAQQYIDQPFIVEDTSLHFHALQGFPGPLVKRTLQHEGAHGLQRLLTGYPNKSATAQCSIGYRDGKQEHIIIGTCDGAIVAPQGDSSFGRDPIFMPDTSNKTFAQMSPQEKNAISHRSKAFQKLLTIRAA